MVGTSTSATGAFVDVRDLRQRHRRRADRRQSAITRRARSSRSARRWSGASPTDRHGNASPSATFTVKVGDTTPPVLKLPGTITAFATSRNGARVNYTVTATDNVDPNPIGEVHAAVGLAVPARHDAGQVQGDRRRRQHQPGDVHRQGDRGVEGPAAADRRRRQRALQGRAADPAALRAGGREREHLRSDREAVHRAARRGGERRARAAGGRAAAGGGQPVLLLADHQPVRDAAGHPPDGVGRWQLRVDLGDGESTPDRITLLR